MKREKTSPSTNIEGLRQAPQSVEAEQSILGAMMLSSDAFDVASMIVREEDFYRRDHRIIWRAISELARKGQPFDAVTLGEWFVAHGFAEMVGGVSYVLELANNTPSARQVRHYANIVKSKSKLRQLIDVATEIAGRAFEPDAKPSLIDWATNQLMQLERVDVSAEYTFGQAIKMAHRSVMDAAIHAAATGKRFRGVTTGLRDVDEQTGGFFRGDLFIIAARPSMGKTALMVNMAYDAAKAGEPVGIITGEQPAEQIGARGIAIGSGVDSSGFRTGDFADEESVRIFAMIERDENLPIWMLDRASPHVNEIASVARGWKKRHGIKALYVDYIQRCQAEGEKRSDVVGNIGRTLKTIARDLDIPVVALSAVKREVEDRGCKIPRMGDLAESSDLEKEADTIAALYREAVYNRTEKNARRAQLVFDKNRHGPTGTVWLDFDERSMRFGCADMQDMFGDEEEITPMQQADQTFKRKYRGKMRA